MFGLLLLCLGLLLIVWILHQKQAQSGYAWWVEIHTAQPACTYYFGPFETADQAKTEQPGYLEDLIQEGSQGIVAEVKWCRPQQLTIF